MRVLLFIFLFHTAILAHENEIHLEKLIFDMEFSTETYIEPIVTNTTNEIAYNNSVSCLFITIDFYFNRIDVRQTLPGPSAIPKYLNSYSILKDNFDFIPQKHQLKTRYLVENARELKKSNATSNWLKPFHNIDAFQAISVLGSGFGPIITLSITATKKFTN